MYFFGETATESITCQSGTHSLRARNKRPDGHTHQRTPLRLPVLSERLLPSSRERRARPWVRYVHTGMNTDGRGSLDVDAGHRGSIRAKRLQRKQEENLVRIRTRCCRVRLSTTSCVRKLFYATTQNCAMRVTRCHRRTCFFTPHSRANKLEHPPPIGRRKRSFPQSAYVYGWMYYMDRKLRQGLLRGPTCALRSL